MRAFGPDKYGNGRGAQVGNPVPIALAPLQLYPVGDRSGRYYAQRSDIQSSPGLFVPLIRLSELALLLSNDTQIGDKCNHRCLLL